MVEKFGTPLKSGWRMGIDSWWTSWTSDINPHHRNLKCQVNVQWHLLKRRWPVGGVWNAWLRCKMYEFEQSYLVPGMVFQNVWKLQPLGDVSYRIFQKSALDIFQLHWTYTLHVPLFHLQTSCNWKMTEHVYVIWTHVSMEFPSEDWCLFIAFFDFVMLQTWCNNRSVSISFLHHHCWVQQKNSYITSI